MKRYSGTITQTFILSLAFLLFSCAAGVSQKSAGKSYYQEDLSQFRPRPPKDTLDKKQTVVASAKDQPLTPAKDVTPRLDKKLQEIGSNAPKVAKGYRVRVYTGNSREEATAMKEKVEAVTNEKVYIEFKTPNFRVKVGDAINRLEANYLLGKLKDEFPGAVILPDEINILP